MRLIEFFESDAGPLSMSRLMMFIGVLVASAIMILLTNTDKMNEGYFGLYLAYCAGVYVSGKAIDMKSTPKGPEVKA